MNENLKRGDGVESIEITDINSEGMGVGRIGERVVFIEGGLPGDICNLKINKIKKGILHAEIALMVRPSVFRTDSSCGHFGVCGGCQWQNLDYNAQLHFKQNQILQVFKRIAKSETGEVLPILGCEEKYFYRNKLDFAFSNKKWLTKEEIEGLEEFPFRNGLGFHKAGAFDKVLDIRECHLQAAPSNEIRNEVRKFVEEKGWSFFDIRKQEGFLRSLIIRNTTGGDWMVIFSFFNEDKEKIESLLGYVRDKFQMITSLLYVINSKGNDTIFDLPVQCFHGRPYIEEQMGYLRFRIGPKSFYQTNSRQALKLYEVVKSLAGLVGTERVYDLYTGAGTIAQFISRGASAVIGVELVKDAIEDAKENARLNQIENCSFFAGNMAEVLSDGFLKLNGKPDVIIADPPRAGMDVTVVKKLLQIQAEKIVYVSCNPASQARDVALLSEKYNVEKMQAVDMFPQTLHIENVALLRLRSGLR